MTYGRYITLFVIALTLTSGCAFAYDFWGITMGTEFYNGGTQLTFDGLAGTNIQYAVGGYQYTRVDSTWYGAFEAASPGEGYTIHRKCDAQGLFFKAEATCAKFMIIAGTPQGGVCASEYGYGSRLFGPGDLKIDVNGNTYGVGMRLSNLPWAVVSTSNPAYQIYKATGGTENIHVRDAGTEGIVELNPRWAHVDHTDLPAYSAAAYAFFVKGSGTQVGSATVNFIDTGVSVGNTPVYAYEVSVPWETIGINPGNCNFQASWRPDCGNDLISASFSAVPEPGGILAILTGIIGLIGYRRRK